MQSRSTQRQNKRIGPYKRRNVVERSFNTLKHWRSLGTRYDKLALTYCSATVLHAVVMEHPIGRHALAAGVQVKPVPQFGTGGVDASRDRGIIPSRRRFHLSEANST